MLKKLKTKILQSDGIIILYAAFLSCLVMPIAAVLYDFYNMETMQNDLKNIQEMAALSCVAGAQNRINPGPCFERMQAVLDSNKSMNGIKEMGAFKKADSNSTGKDENGDILARNGMKYSKNSLDRRENGNYFFKTKEVHGQDKQHGGQVVEVQICGYYQPFFFKFLERFDLDTSPKLICSRDSSKISAIYVQS